MTQSGFLSLLISSLCSESDSSGKHGGNVSLDVLPVKGPQGSPLLSQAVRPPQDKSSSEEMWTVQPEQLILLAPSPCEYVSENMTGLQSGTQGCTFSVALAHLERIRGLFANVTNGLHTSSSHLLVT